MSDLGLLMTPIGKKPSIQKKGEGRGSYMVVQGKGFLSLEKGELCLDWGGGSTIYQEGKGKKQEWEKKVKADL